MNIKAAKQSIYAVPPLGGNYTEYQHDHSLPTHRYSITNQKKILLSNCRNADIISIFRQRHHGNPTEQAGG